MPTAPGGGRPGSRQISSPLVTKGTERRTGSQPGNSAVRHETAPDRPCPDGPSLQDRDRVAAGPARQAAGAGATDRPGQCGESAGDGHPYHAHVPMARAWGSRAIGNRVPPPPADRGVTWTAPSRHQALTIVPTLVCRYVGHIAGSPSTGPGRQGGDHDVVYVGMRKAMRVAVVLEGGDHPALGLDRREPAEARVLQELERRIVS
jgi:hypothetical protein